MPYLGEIYSLACALLWSFGVVCFRKLGESTDPQDLNLLKNSMAGLWFLACILLIPSVELSALTYMDWLILIFSGFLGISLADTLLLRSLQLIGAGRYAIIECLYTPCVILFSYLFLKERLEPGKWIGIVLILCGVGVSLLQKHFRSIDESQLKRGVIIGLLSPIFIAAGIVMTKPILERASALEVTTIRTLAGAVGNLIWLGAFGRLSSLSSRLRGRVQWRTLLIAVFLGSFLAPLLWIAGFKHTQASLASVLNQTSVFFIIVMSAMILKERLTFPKITGAILGFAGALCIFLI